MIHSIISFLLVAGFSFNFVYLLSYSNSSRKKTDSGRLIFGILLIGLLEIGNGILIHSKLILIYPHLLRVNTPFIFLVGPIFWMLIRVKLGGPALRRIDTLHFVPFAICLLALLPFYFSGDQYKLQYLNEMYQGTNNHTYWIGGFKRVQQGIYIMAMVKLLWDEKGTSLIRELNFSKTLFLGFFLLWSISIARFFFWFPLNGGLIEIMILCATAAYLVYSGTSNAMKPEPTEKYRTSGLTIELINSYSKRIVKTIEEERAFVNPKLTLASFSKLAGIPPHHISQVLSQGMKTNFKELINQYRVDEAKRLLQSPETLHLKIETVSELAGFRSISSFNHSFKERTGVSPKSCRPSK